MSACGRPHGDDLLPSPSHLLEVTVISAQDLHRRRLGRRVRAYTVAWADPAHKLRTAVDRAGGGAPTWNDRFLFRVDDAFLRSDTAAVTVEVRGARGLGLGADPVLGLTRIVVSTFVRPGRWRRCSSAGRARSARRASSTWPSRCWTPRIPSAARPTRPARSP
jgi:hypothetical protein